jgi:small conductance mechanosensitive channel
MRLLAIPTAMPALASPAPTSSPAPTCQLNPLSGLCTAVQNATGGSSSAIGPLIQHIVEGIIVFLIVLIAGRLLRRLVRGAVHRAAADPQLRVLVHNVLTVFTWLAAVVAGLVAGGLEATWVFTFGGIFSLAIGLAFQDLLRNVLAGIWVLVEKPFRIGDRVAVGDQAAGTVRDIALRTTSLVTEDGRIAVLPNLMVFQNAVVVGDELPQKTEPPAHPPVPSP